MAPPKPVEWHRQTSIRIWIVSETETCPGTQFTRECEYEFRMTTGVAHVQRARRVPRRDLRLAIHAKDKITGRIIPFLALGFWVKNASVCMPGGDMPYRREFLPTTRI